MCIHNLKTLALTEAETFETENLLGQKENRQIKRMTSSSMLIFFYVIQQVKPNIHTKFQNTNRCSSWEIYWETGKMEKRQKLITASWFSFPQYTCLRLRFTRGLDTYAYAFKRTSTHSWPYLPGFVEELLLPWEPIVGRVKWCYVVSLIQMKTDLAFPFFFLKYIN